MRDSSLPHTRGQVKGDGMYAGIPRWYPFVPNPWLRASRTLLIQRTQRISATMHRMRHFETATENPHTRLDSASPCCITSNGMVGHLKNDSETSKAGTERALHDAMQIRHGGLRSWTQPSGIAHASAMQPAPSSQLRYSAISRHEAQVSLNDWPGKLFSVNMDT